ncbi:MAG: DUF5060 domain-containing protein [Bacteroidota bacterium]
MKAIFCLALLFVTISCFSQIEVLSFTLVDASTDIDIGPLQNNDTIDLSSLNSTDLNIRANTNPAEVGSVVFAYDGNPNFQTESVAPYALAGDNAGDYAAWTPTVGTHVLVATPYSLSGGGGVAGTSLSIQFVVINGVGGSDPCTNPSPVALGVSGELKKWHKVTITFQGPNTTETDPVNPFLDYRLNVTFTNGNTSFVVPGYYAADGNAAESGASCGDRWQVHFSPNNTGTWNYMASFRTGNEIAVSMNPTDGTPVEFDGQTGSFDITPSDKTGLDLRGKGRLEYIGERYLKFADGDYFLKIGADAPENFLAYDDFDNTPNIGNRRKSWSAHIPDWNQGDVTWRNDLGKGIIGAVNYLADQGQNVFSFLTMNIEGDDENVYPYINSGDRRRIDVSKVAQWELVFEHAVKMGMYLHFKTQETENDQLLDGGSLGVERKFYYRELIARFGHHLALNWNIGEENTNTNTQRQEFAAFFHDLDPYQHNIVIHTYPNDDDAVYTPLLGAGTEYTGASLQVNWNSVHSRTLEWIDKSTNAGKIWVVANDEQGSANIGVPDNSYNGTPSLAEVRHKTLWGHFMAGGAGVEYYFGYSLPHSDLTCEDFASRSIMWNYNRITHAFFTDYLPFWEMENRNDMVDQERYCLAKVGEVYAVYIPPSEAGTAELFLPNDGNTYEIEWYDPRNGGALQAGSIPTVTGTGTSVNLGVAPNSPDEDWVVLVRESGVVTSVSTLNEQTDIYIYPNPCSDILHFNMPVEGEVEIINIYGQQVIRSMITNHINVSSLSRGIYFYRLKINGGQRYAGTFMKG